MADQIEAARRQAEEAARQKQPLDLSKVRDDTTRKAMQAAYEATKRKQSGK